MKYFGISLGSRTNLRDSSKPRPFVDLVGHVERDVLKGVQFLYVTDVDTKVPAIIDDPLKSGSLFRAIRDRGHRGRGSSVSPVLLVLQPRAARV